MNETLIEGMLAMELPSRLQLAASCIGILILAWVMQKISPNALSTFPHVGKGSTSARRGQFAAGAAWDLYLEGYRMMKNGAQCFRIATTAPDETIVVSSKFLNELKKLPEDVLSSKDAIAETLQSTFTKVAPEIPGLPHTVKTSLTPALLRLNPTISKEVYESMSLELPQTKEWTEVNINSKLLRIVAMVSGRIFVGPKLCRDERYLDMAINYTIDLMTAAYIVAAIPQWLRPVIAPFVPHIKRVHKRIDEAMGVLQPVIAARQEAAKDSDAEKPDDMLQWIMDSQEALGQHDTKELAKMQLGTSFAAIHTTTLVTTNAFYTLAAMPHLVPMLRDDVEAALQTTNGEFTNSSMQNMKKLDSFLKEILRFHPFSASSFQRKVLKPFTMSNGQCIPAGVFLEVPSGGMSFDEDIFPNANTFDALRYYKLRQSKDAESSHTKAAEVVASSQFIGVGTTSLTFGYGRHACPGRFFAANEIKMIMAVFLMHYEAKNPPGVTERHKNKWHGAQSMPDPEKTIMVRKI